MIRYAYVLLRSVVRAKILAYQRTISVVRLITRTLRKRFIDTYCSLLSLPNAASSAVWIVHSMATVIGSLMCGWWVVPSARARLIPARTLVRTAREEWSRGSGKPIEICVFRTADRYMLTVCWVSPLSARNAAKRQNICSDKGKGLLTLRVLHIV